MVSRVRVKTAPKRASAKRAPAKARTRKPAKRVVAEWPREPALEQAIIEAPLDPVPRMVYADWLQAAGDRRGEWMALHAAIENEPTNVRLRSAAVDFLGANLDLLLGPGKALIAGGWIGWRAGFIDELRIQPSHKRGVVQSFAGLLAHPSCRFVRCVGLGDLGQEAIDALVAAAPPLLDTVVVIDSSMRPARVDIDALAGLPSIRRLGLLAAEIKTPMPGLVEVAGYIGGVSSEWIAGGGCPNIERLSLDCGRPGTLKGLLDAVPKVRRLCLLHLGAVELEHILVLRNLEHLDLSYGRFDDAALERFVGWRGLTLVLHRANVTAAAVEKLRKSGVTVEWTAGAQRLELDQEPGGWLHHRLAAEGRDGLKTLPGIGRLLFNIGTHHSIRGEAKDATPLLDASLTFPDADLKTWAWANAAIAHERMHEFDDAELIAREGLLRAPKEPNLYAIIVDALRRTDRLAEAEALLPRALASIDAKPGPGAHSGGRAACLADVMLVLAQAGRHDEVLELAEKYKPLVEQRRDMFAILAMSLVAVGKLAAARSALAKADAARFPAMIAHAQAVVALAAKKPNLPRVLELLRAAKEAPYPEWHWIASDPNLAKLEGNPVFVELVT